MLSLLAEKLRNRIVFITGSGKNSGKTTFMNYVLNSIRGSFSIAYLSIGVDGEKKDAVFNNLKPQVFAEKGDYLITVESSLKNSDAGFEIHEVFPVSTVLGKVVLARIFRGGRVELIGPDDNSQLAEIVRYLNEAKGIGTILVDGAVNRITQISSVLNATFIYVAKVTPANLMKSIKLIKTFSLIENFPVVDDPAKSESLNLYYFDGALTESKLGEIPKECDGIVLDDFTKFFIGYEEIVHLASKKKIFYKNSYSLAYISVNLYDVSEKKFLELMGKESMRDRIIFNPYTAAVAETV